MSKLFESQAFQEFLQKRCEEIITEDEECREVDRLITNAETILKTTFSSIQLETFLQYEKLCSDYQLISNVAIYKKCLCDIHMK